MAMGGCLCNSVTESCIVTFFLLIEVLSISSVSVCVCVCVRVRVCVWRNPLEPSYSGLMQVYKEILRLYRLTIYSPTPSRHKGGILQFASDYSLCNPTAAKRWLCKCKLWERIRILTAVLCRQVLWVDLNLLSGGGGGSFEPSEPPLPAYGPDTGVLYGPSEWKKLWGEASSVYNYSKKWKTIH